MKSTLIAASSNPALPFKVPAEAVKLVEQMQAKGVQVQRLPPADVTRTLTYAALSDFLDAVVMDMHRVCPEIFSTTSATNVTPGRLKAYLYVQAVHHFRQAGILVNTGGVSFPEAAGTACPNPLLAYLQYIGIYAEGDTTGRGKFVVPASIPVVGNTGIAAGAVSETNISNSSQALNLLGYQLNTAQGEVILQAQAADSNNVIVNWNSNSDSISDILESCNYPTSPMWAVPPPIPDGSFFAFYTRNKMGSGAGMQLFTSPFDKWDVEIAALYSLTTPSGPYGAVFAPRMGPMDSEWPNAWTGSTYSDPFWIRKEMFIFIIRNNTYTPGMPTEALRAYHGDPLSSFRCIPVLTHMAAWHEAVARAWQQLRDNGAAWGSGSLGATQLLSFNLVCDHAFMRRYQLNTIGEQSTPAFTALALQPSNADQLVIPAPLAQLLNDYGPVVRDGLLHLPFFQFTTGDAWFELWDVIGDNSAGIMQMFHAATKKTTGTDADLNWQAVNGATKTLNGAWVTAYKLLTNYLYVSWYAVYRAHTIMVQFLSNGAGYGKGDILYPVSKGPRGGLVMLTRCSFGSAVTDPLDTTNNITITYLPLAVIGSYVPITGAEIAMAVIEGWTLSDSTFISTCKYVKTFSSAGENAAVLRYTSVTLGQGGTFLDALSNAMERRHGPMMDGSSGLTSANDNTDACLWDAIKRTVGTIAGALQPAASKAAGIGCGMIPVIGQFAKPVCEAAATNLTSLAVDASKSSTNRHAATTARKELTKYASTVKPMKRVEDHEISEERQPHLESFANDDLYRPIRSRRTGFRYGDEEIEYQPRRRKGRRGGRQGGGKKKKNKGRKGRKRRD